MADTSPAALKAWVRDKAKISDTVITSIREKFGDGAAARYAIGDAAMFRAVAALADLAAGGGWRTMDSAPKPSHESYELIDVWMAPIPERQKQFSNPDKVGFRLTDAWWTERPDYTGYRNARSYNGRELNHRPTHWRPLPAPPMENDDG